MPAETTTPRTDTERLDAMQRWAEAYISEGGFGPIVELEVVDGDDDLWSVVGMRRGAVTQIGEGTTLRDAIDDALQQEFAARRATPTGERTA